MHVCDKHGQFIHMDFCPMCGRSGEVIGEAVINKSAYPDLAKMYEKNPFTPANPDPRGPYKEQVQVRGWLLTYIYKDSDGLTGHGNLEHFRIGESEPTFKELCQMRDNKLAESTFLKLIWQGVFKCGIIPLDEIPARTLEALKADAEKAGVELI